MRRRVGATPLSKPALLFIASPSLSSESGSPTTSGRAVRAGEGGWGGFVTRFFLFPCSEATLWHAQRERVDDRPDSIHGSASPPLDLFLWRRFHRIDGSRCELGRLIQGEEAEKNIDCFLSPCGERRGWWRGAGRNVDIQTTPIIKAYSNSR